MLPLQVFPLGQPAGLTQSRSAMRSATRSDVAKIYRVCTGKHLLPVEEKPDGCALNALTLAVGRDQFPHGSGPLDLKVHLNVVLRQNPDVN